MIKLAVFDLDGTLSNCEHRRHYVMTKPKNWPAFNRKMHLDTPYQDIILMSQILQQAGFMNVMATGRGAENREVTTKWLVEHQVPFSKLYMRPEKDSRSDDIVKVEILNQIIDEYGKPVYWFDDRQQVVDAIRNQGIRVLQVAAGNF